MKRLIHYFSDKKVFLVTFFILVIVSVSLNLVKSRNVSTVPVVTEVVAASTPLSKPTSGNEFREKTSFAVSDNLSKLVLNVSNMSCSGCISTIKASVSNVPGIKETLVEISTGKVEIYFDGNELKDLPLVAKSITDSGYPATIVKVLSPEDLKKEQNLLETRSKYYVASVGGWDIARSDFDMELDRAKKQYQKIYGENLFTKNEQANTLLNNLKTQILSKLVDEGIMMQEIVKADFKVQKELVENQFNEFLKGHGKKMDEFKVSLSDAGYDYGYFRKKFETKILINQYINERVLSEASNEFEKQKLFGAWFQNSKTLAQVVYYDKELKGLVQSQSSSGGCSVR